MAPTSSSRRSSRTATRRSSLHNAWRGRPRRRHRDDDVLALDRRPRRRAAASAIASMAFTLQPGPEDGAVELAFRRASRRRQRPCPSCCGALGKPRSRSPTRPALWSTACFSRICSTRPLTERTAMEAGRGRLLHVAGRGPPDRPARSDRLRRDRRRQRDRREPPRRKRRSGPPSRRRGCTSLSRPPGKLGRKSGAGFYEYE